FRKMRSEFWPLQNYHRIDIFDREVFRLQQSAGVLEENQAVRTLPLRVAIRKVRANIAKSCRAKKRVTQCVGEHVSIGMADRTLVERHFDPADHQLAALGKPMKIVANPAAHAHGFLCSPWR